MEKSKIILSKEDEHLRDLDWYVVSGGYFRRAVPSLVGRAYELLHRVVAQAKDGQVVDHINGDLMDNRRENLRVCTHAENMRNRKAHSNNATGLKGVYKFRDRFVAQIRVSGKKHYLGSFLRPEDAKTAYDAAASVLHGEFARLK